MDHEMERCLDGAIEHVERAVKLARARGWEGTATECSRALGRLNGVLYEVRSGEVVALEAEMKSRVGTKKMAPGWAPSLPRRSDALASPPRDHAEPTK